MFLPSPHRALREVRRFVMMIAEEKNMWKTIVAQLLLYAGFAFLPLPLFTQSVTGFDKDYNNYNQLMKELTNAGYLELFHRFNKDTLNSIWNEKGAQQFLELIASDVNTPSLLASFLGAEILFFKQPGYPPETAKKQLAVVYSTALKENFTLMANPWSLPGSLDGLAGEHFVALGEYAIPELILLLDNNTPLSYSGSNEATFGNHYKYRVKDMAFFYICEIRKIPFTLIDDPVIRDKNIKKFKETIKK
jgi:hypothetical protein